MNIRRFLFVAAALSLATLTFQSCSDEFKFNAEMAPFPVFVAVGDGQIPDYSECGYNTAGAMLTVTKGRNTISTTWTMNYSMQGGSQLATLTKGDGKTGNDMMFPSDKVTLKIVGYKLAPLESATVTFEFSFSLADSLGALKQLAGQAPPCTATFSGSNSTYYQPVQSSSATLKFGRCRNIYKTDGALAGVSLSGTFAMQGRSDTINVQLSDGRFDLLFGSYDHSEYSTYGTYNQPKSSAFR